MLKRVAVLILALSIILSLSGCFGGGGNSNGIKTFNVMGTVTSTVDGLGISGATVSINDDYNFTAYTNQAGHYQLNGVTTYDSTVKITVSKDGYEVQSKYQSITGGSSYIWDFELVPKSSGGGVLVRGWVDYGYNESYGQTASYSISSHRAWAEPDMFKEPDSVIVELAGDVRTASVSTLMRDVNAREYKVRDIINRVIITVPEGESLDDFMAKLMESPMVRSVEPNSFVYAARVPDDEYYVSDQKLWLQLMNLPAAWEKTTGSSGVTIAVVDTGIRYGHLDLPSRQNLVSPRDYVDNDYDPFDPGAPPEDEKRYSVASHGTHVAGTIGALTNNRIGVAGVDWSVSLMPIRVLDENGNGYVSDVAAGIRWAVDNGADVINLSLGSSAFSPALQDAVRHAYNNDVAVVAASGNDYRQPVCYPAAYPEVIAVGAASGYDPFAVADFSNGGDELDLIAPGVRVYSTNYNSRTGVLGYELANGTSMACPHVAGVVGLMLAEDPLLTPDKVRRILRETAIRPGNGQVWDTWQGYGFINAYTAVTQATLDKAHLVVLDEQLELASAVVAPGSDRGFAFYNVPRASLLYVFGWLDVDGSGSLDVGDYTGYKEIPTYGQNEVDASFRLNIHSAWDAGTQEFIASGLEAMGAH